jgi:hypothetical protein
MDSDIDFGDSSASDDDGELHGVVELQNSGYDLRVSGKCFWLR